MKRNTLILSVFAAAAMLCGACTNQVPATGTESAAAPVAQKGSIVYFNLDRVLDEYDMASDLSSVVEAKAQSIEQELNRRGNKLQSDVNAFQDKINKGTIIRSVAEQQSQKLAQQQQEFENYYAQKQAEMQEESAVVMNQIADAIKQYLDKLNEEKQYAMIISTQGGLLPAPVAAGSAEFDITDAVIAGLNAEYQKTKNQ